MLALRRRRRSPGVRRAAADRTAALEPLAAFGRLRSALVASGCGFEPSDGVEEVRRAAAGDAALLGALDVVERTLYASTMPPSHVRLATAELLDARTARLLATV